MWTLLNGFLSVVMPFLNADGGGGGGQGGAGGNSGGGTNDGGGGGTPPNNQGGGAGGAGGQGGQGSPEDLQQQINAAAAAARRQAEKEAKEANDRLAKELGYESWDDMQAKLKEQREKSMTEAEKAKKAAEEAAAKAQAERERANRIAINAALQVLARDMGCDPDVAVAMVDRSQITVGDDGTVTGAKEALEALKKAKPHLFTTNKPGQVGGTTPPGGGGAPESPKERARQIAEERARSRSGGQSSFWGRKQ